MKKISLLLLFVLFITTAYAQSFFNYQAIIRDSEGNTVKNTNLEVTLSILDSFDQTVYEEEHSASTDRFGIINLEVGTGIQIIGEFDQIKWNENLLIKTNIRSQDAGGIDLQGESNIGAVPKANYSFVAERLVDELRFQSDWNIDDPQETGYIKNKPSIPSSFSGDYNDLSNIPDLAQVATSGEYDDLKNKPTIPELQNLELDGKNLSISEGNTVNLAVLNSDNQKLSKTGSTISLENGGDITLNDDDPANEIQDLSLVGNNLKITNNTSATVINLSTFNDNTDDQTISKSGAIISLEDGGSVTLDDDDSTNELQDLSGAVLNGSNVLSINIENGTGTTADLSALADNTDDQTLSLSGTTLSIEDGNSINLSSITSDDQDLSEVLSEGNDAGDKQIKNLADPTDDKDAVTKYYAIGQLNSKVDKETGKRLSANDYTDAEKAIVADAEIQTNKNAANGYAGLDANKKIDESQLPKITVGNVFAVNTEAEQLALSASRGDVAVRSDINKTYMHNGGSAGDMTDWTEVKTPTGEVFSVNGKKGDVSITINDIPGLQTTINNMADLSNVYTRSETNNLLDKKIDEPTGQNSKMLTTDSSGNLVWADKTTFTDTDDQTLGLSGNTLSISEGNSVDLTPLLTDEQDLGDVLSNGNDAKNKQIKNMASPTDDKDAVNKIYLTGELFGKVDKETGKRLSTNDYTDAEKATVADAEVKSNKNVTGGYPGLDSNKKIDEAQLPKITVGNVFAIDSEPEQLALTASRGDVAVRSDLNKTFIHNGGSTGNMNDWTEMKTPSGEVFSVNGKKGDVSITISDIPGLQGELDDKSNAGDSYTKAETDNLLDKKIDIPTNKISKMLTTDGSGNLIWADQNTFTDTDDQTLSISGTSLSIQDGNTVDLSGINSDDQQISKTGSTISLEDGGSINLNDDEATNEIQDLTGAVLDGANVLSISIENGTGTTVDLSTLADNTDDQTAAEVNYNNTSSGLTATTVQTAIDELNTGSTDDQNISGSGLSGTTLTIGIEDGTSETVDLSSLDDIADGTSSGNTVRWNGTAWLESSVLKNDGTNVTASGDIAVNGGDITSSASTFNLVNTNATTVNIAGTSTTTSIGASSGTTTINNDLSVSGNFYNPSDKRLKANIETLTNVLSKLEQIRGVQFEYKDKEKYTAGVKIGVIAQEINRVYPELVTTGKDGYLKVDYTQLTGILIQAVKEQQRQIEGQQKQIDLILEKLNLK